MTNTEMKKEELNCSQIWAGYVNLIVARPYTLFQNNDEDKHNPEVDVYARSENNEVWLQIKTVDKDYMPGFVARGKEAERNKSGVSSIHVRDLNITEWIKQTIGECNKQYSADVRKTLVLLLCVKYGGEMNTEYAEKIFSEYSTSDFRGIYFIDQNSKVVIVIKSFL